jgi:vacuolar protein sorting-associated protein 13A/C
MGMNLFVLEDPDSVSSEAIQLSVKNITFAQQGNMSLSVDGVAAAFVNMDCPSSQVQFIEPFDVSATVELSSTKAEKATQVWVAIQPIILRFSYQDIQFFSKIGEQFSKKPSLKTDVIEGTENAAEVSPVASNVSSPLPSESTLLQSSIASSVTKVIEQVQINLEGITAVFIDDFSNVHIPLLEVSFDRMAAHIQDWSSALKVNGVLKLRANFFNRLNSHWEPVLEPWSLDLSLLTQKNGRGKGYR